MELYFSQMALEVSHHGYLLDTHLTTPEHCCHTSFHAYWYMNVMRSSRLFRVSLFLENGFILMIWRCFSIVSSLSNVIRSNYCCRMHTMLGNMVFSRDYSFPTPQQSGCLLACSVSPQFWERYSCSFFRVFFADIKSTFKLLSPYTGHGFTIISLYYYVRPRGMVMTFVLVHLPRNPINLTECRSSCCGM